MHFGGAMFFTDYSMSAPELARALEERGFESVWAPEPSHIPLSRNTPFPGGGELPKQYYDAMDPFVVLVACARWSRLRCSPDAVMASSPGFGQRISTAKRSVALTSRRASSRERNMGKPSAAVKQIEATSVSCAARMADDWHDQDPSREEREGAPCGLDR
jgi:hypothetical protein